MAQVKSRWISNNSITPDKVDSLDSKTFYVDNVLTVFESTGSQNRPFKTISQALTYINTLEVEEPKTLFVNSGVYEETTRIILSNNVTLISVGKVILNITLNNLNNNYRYGLMIDYAQVIGDLECNVIFKYERSEGSFASNDIWVDELEKKLYTYTDSWDIGITYNNVKAEFDDPQYDMSNGDIWIDRLNQKYHIYNDGWGLGVSYNNLYSFSLNTFNFRSISGVIIIPLKDSYVEGLKCTLNLPYVFNNIVASIYVFSYGTEEDEYIVNFNNIKGISTNTVNQSAGIFLDGLHDNINLNLRFDQCTGKGTYTSIQTNLRDIKIGSLIFSNCYVTSELFNFAGYFIDTKSKMLNCTAQGSYLTGFGLYPSVELINCEGISEIGGVGIGMANFEDSKDNVYIKSCKGVSKGVGCGAGIAFNGFQGKSSLVLDSVGISNNKIEGKVVLDQVTGLDTEYDEYLYIVGNYPQDLQTNMVYLFVNKSLWLWDYKNYNLINVNRLMQSGMLDCFSYNDSFFVKDTYDLGCRFYITPYKDIGNRVVNYVSIDNNVLTGGYSGSYIYGKQGEFLLLVSDEMSGIYLYDYGWNKVCNVIDGDVFVHGKQGTSIFNDILHKAGFADDSIYIIEQGKLKILDQKKVLNYIQSQTPNNPEEGEFWLKDDEFYKYIKGVWERLNDSNLDQCEVNLLFENNNDLYVTKEGSTNIGISKVDNILSLSYIAVTNDKVSAYNNLITLTPNTNRNYALIISSKDDFELYKYESLSWNLVNLLEDTIMIHEGWSYEDNNPYFNRYGTGKHIFYNSDTSELNVLGSVNNFDYFVRFDSDLPEVNKLGLTCYVKNKGGFYISDGMYNWVLKSPYRLNSYYKYQDQLLINFNDMFENNQERPYIYAELVDVVILKSIKGIISSPDEGDLCFDGKYLLQYNEGNWGIYNDKVLNRIFLYVEDNVTFVYIFDISGKIIESKISLGAGLMLQLEKPFENTSILQGYYQGDNLGINFVGDIDYLKNLKLDTNYNNKNNLI